MNSNKRTFQWIEPAGEEVDPFDPWGEVIRTVTAEDIRRDYWPWWQREMHRLGRDYLITFDNCIADFMVVHWAWEVESC